MSSTLLAMLLVLLVLAGSATSWPRVVASHSSLWRSARSVEQGWPPVFNTYPRDTLIEVNSTVELTCRATGDPLPMIGWSKEGGSVPWSRAEQLADGTLRIERLQSEDDGVYVCQATNSAATVTTTARLVVYSKPSFLERPEDQSVGRGDTAILRCVVSGHPPPTLTWRKGDQPYPLFPGQQHERYSVWEDGTLQILDVRGEDGGEWECQATGRAFYVTATATLTVTDTGTTTDTDTGTDTAPVPDSPPGHVRVRAASDTVLVVSWEPPPHTHTHSLSYRVQFALSPVTSSSLYHEVEVSDDSRLVLLRQLLPNHSYSISVTACTTTGCGPRSQPVTVLTSTGAGAEEAPPTSQAPPTTEAPPTSEAPRLQDDTCVLRRAPQNLSASQQTDGTVRLTCAPPPCPLTDPHPLTYRVRYSPASDVTALYTYDVTDTFLDVRGLELGAEYVFSVQARNRVGVGPWADDLHVTILGTAPPAPSHVTVSRPSPTSMRVQWEAPQRGVRGYKVFYTPITTTHVWRSLQTAPTTTLTITGLEPRTSYFVRVQAQASDGRYGDISDRVVSFYDR